MRPALDEMSASQWIRCRRRALGVTTAEVAARAGLTASQVEDVESGRNVAGLDLVRAALAARPSELLLRNRQAVLEAARRHGVRDVRVFGSVARGDDTAGSDVDLLVDLQGRSAFDLIAFQDEAARALTVPVDVITDNPGLTDRVRTVARAEAVSLRELQSPDTRPTRKLPTERHTERTLEQR